MNNFIMMIGLPASGKSTISEKYKSEGYIIHSSDALREEMLNDVNAQHSNAQIFEEMHKRVRYDLAWGKNVVYDATNLIYKRRRAFLDSIQSNVKHNKKLYNCNKKAVVIATPYNDCIDRDLNRERKVGSTVLERMYKSFTMPSEIEGFDKVEIVYSEEIYDEFDWSKDFSFLRNISQNNTNHTKTIGMHCYETAQKLIKDSDELYMAGMLHDYGKLKTMSFKDSKGKFSTQCHYYSHESISAYDAMFYTKDLSMDTVHICNLIQYHMRPHLMTTEKSINKFKRFVGEEFWNDLMKLHEADKNSR